MPRISNMYRLSKELKGTNNVSLIREYEKLRNDYIKVCPEKANEYGPPEEFDNDDELKLEIKSLKEEIKILNQRIETVEGDNQVIKVDNKVIKEEYRVLKEEIEIIKVDNKVAKYILCLQDLNRKFKLERVGGDKNFSPAAREAFVNLRESRNSAAHYLNEEDSPVLINYKLRLILNEFSEMSVACREQVEDVVYCDDFINEVQFYLEEKVKELPPIDEL
jgi:hypothetical protein